MRRDKVGRRTATLMYAGSHRRSAMRRMVPLTRNASRITPGRIDQTGIFPAAAVAPAHGGTLAHLRAAEVASWLVLVTSRGHLGPEEPAELSGDGGDHDVARALALGQAAELGAEMELGGPGPGDGVVAGSAPGAS